MKKRFFPWLALVAIALASLGCDLGDAMTAVEVGGTVATIIAPTPTLYATEPAKITIRNLTPGDICQVDFHLPGVDSIRVGRPHQWDRGVFSSSSQQTIEQSKWSWDIYAYDCDGNLVASRKDVALYSDQTIVMEGIE